MPDLSMYTLEAAMTEANVVRLSIANPAATPTPTEAKIRLFASGFTPDWTTTKAQLVAAEVTFGGYPVGGYEVLDLLPPAQVSGGGVVITTPLINVEYTIAPGEAVGGGWLEDGAGLVRQVYLFDPVKTLGSISDAFLIVRQMGFGRNP